MSTPDKKRWPREDAENVAMDLCERLEPVCVRVVIAGSVRRRKPTVGDVELVFIPRFERRQVAPELFPRLADLADLALEKLLRDGILAKRPNKNGGSRSLDRLDMPRCEWYETRDHKCGEPAEYTMQSWYGCKPIPICKKHALEASSDCCTTVKRQNARHQPRETARE
jgi:hypothetical protein